MYDEGLWLILMLVVAGYFVIRMTWEKRSGMMPGVFAPHGMHSSFIHNVDRCGTMEWLRYSPEATVDRMWELRDEEQERRNVSREKSWAVRFWVLR